MSALTNAARLAILALSFLDTANISRVSPLAFNAPLVPPHSLAGDTREGHLLPVRHIIPISGKDSLATAIWQTAHEPRPDYEFVFNDTSAELPETYLWLERVSAMLEIRIYFIGKSLEQIIIEQGMLPSAMTRFCTKYAKIYPLRDFLKGSEATVYLGLRADEPERIGSLPIGKLKFRYPLREARIGLESVYAIVASRQLLPPAFFWSRLYEEVMRQVSPAGRSIVEGWTQWQRDRVFAWRSRPNCFFCFFQRRYEWVGLLEFYPELFGKAQEIELRPPDDNRRVSGGFTWINGYPLSELREDAEEIFRKRVDAICRLIDAQRQGDLFAATLDEMDLAGTSCGVLCGK